MPPVDSTPARAAMFAEATDAVFLYLVTIDHAELPAPLRFVANAESVISRGEIYEPAGFETSFPKDGDAAAGDTTIVIDNTDRKIVETLRTLADWPVLILECVLASSPDSLENGPFRLALKSVNYDASRIEGTLSWEEDFLNEPFPGSSFVPAQFPGLF